MLPSDSISNHGNLLGLARSMADRFGWKAEATGLDLDADAAGPIPKPDPGAGNLLLSRGSRTVAIPYHLPEDPDVISSTVRDIIAAAETSSVLRERDRRC